MYSTGYRHNARREFLYRHLWRDSMRRSK